MEGIAKFDFSWKSLFKNFRLVFSGFVDALGTVFLIFYLDLGNKLENKAIFDEIPNLE